MLSKTFFDNLVILHKEISNKKNDTIEKVHEEYKQNNLFTECKRKKTSEM
jgi:hypothetical protein